MALNCGPDSPHLVESGTVRATKRKLHSGELPKRGIVEWAERRRSCSLDEIGELSHDVQVKLLRFLEERSFRKSVGIKRLMCEYG